MLCSKLNTLKVLTYLELCLLRYIQTYSSIVSIIMAYLYIYIYIYMQMHIEVLLRYY